MRGTVPEEATPLWAGALVVAVASGTRVDEATGQERLKLRPIALAEALLKLGECIAVDESAARLRRVLEPWQLGIVTPGGVQRAVRLIQAWAEALAEQAAGHAAAEEELGACGAGGRARQLELLQRQ
eukprot:6013716-Lingulodinium_polyedra.AAC.1